MAQQPPWTHISGWRSDVEHEQFKAELLKHGIIRPEPDLKWNYWKNQKTPGGTSNGFVAFVPGAPFYEFGKLRLRPNEPTETLVMLWEAVKKQTGIPYNCALVCLCHGIRENSLSPHKDNEPIFDQGVDIASFSTLEHKVNPKTKKPLFRRFFVIRDGAKERIPLGHGDFFCGPLCTMEHGREKPFSADVEWSESIVVTWRKLM